MNHLRAQWRAAASSWWESQPDDEVISEWHYSYDGNYGVVHYNDQYGMWGKTWPVYQGMGDSWMAHNGVMYYGQLHTLLEMEEMMRERGIPIPPRRKLLNAKGVEV